MNRETELALESRAHFQWETPMDWLKYKYGGESVTLMYFIKMHASNDDILNHFWEEMDTDNYFHKILDDRCADCGEEVREDEAFVCPDCNCVYHGDCAKPELVSIDHDICYLCVEENEDDDKG